ncbi:hypothetical protein C0J52_22077, partial [Blattella germanica]
YILDHLAGRIATLLLYTCLIVLGCRKGYLTLVKGDLPHVIPPKELFPTIPIVNSPNYLHDITQVYKEKIAAYRLEYLSLPENSVLLGPNNFHKDSRVKKIIYISHILKHYVSPDETSYKVKHGRSYIITIHHNPSSLLHLTNFFFCTDRVRVYGWQNCRRPFPEVVALAVVVVVEYYYWMWQQQQQEWDSPLHSALHRHRRPNFFKNIRSSKFRLNEILKHIHLAIIQQDVLPMAVAEVAEEGEEVVFVPVLGNITALCCESPPLCTPGVVGGIDDVGVVAVGCRIRPNAAVRSLLLGLSLFDLCNLQKKKKIFKIIQPKEERRHMKEETSAVGYFYKRFVTFYKKNFLLKKKERKTVLQKKNVAERLLKHKTWKSFIDLWRLPSTLAETEYTTGNFRSGHIVYTLPRSKVNVDDDDDDDDDYA